MEKDKIIKLIHLKSQTSVALPIYSSDLGNLTQVEGLRNKTKVSLHYRYGHRVSVWGCDVTMMMLIDKDGEVV